jgi:isatin hydrolase
MSSKQTLNDLVDALASGAIEIVDLSGPLGPKTPLIKIPPECGPDTPP